MYLIKHEGRRFRVGFADCQGIWHPDSEWGTYELAAARITYLANDTPIPMGTIHSVVLDPSFKASLGRRILDKVRLGMLERVKSWKR